MVWYENPTWKVHTIVTSKTKPDNVCIAAHDIDGDGQLDLVLGADWNPSNTKTGGTLQWLKRGKTLDEEWTVHPIGEEPTVHRVRMADIDGDGKAGDRRRPAARPRRDREGQLDGRPAGADLAYPIPKDPVKGPWKPKVLSEELHVVHNFWPMPRAAERRSIFAASYEGVIARSEPRWQVDDHANRRGQPGQSEGQSRGERDQDGSTERRSELYIATIEPWHGNQVVVYTHRPKEGRKLWDRHVIDDHLRWGHAVWCADLDGDEEDELIIGVRDNPAKTDKFTEKCGVRIYKATDGVGKKWARDARRRRRRRGRRPDRGRPERRRQDRHHRRRPGDQEREDLLESGEVKLRSPRRSEGGLRGSARARIRFADLGSLSPRSVGSAACGPARLRHACRSNSLIPGSCSCCRPAIALALAATGPAGGPPLSVAHPPQRHPRARFPRIVGEVLRLLAVTAAILALAGPRTPDLKTRLPADGIAILFVLDTSGSMEEPTFIWDAGSSPDLPARGRQAVAQALHRRRRRAGRHPFRRPVDRERDRRGRPGHLRQLAAPGLPADAQSLGAAEPPRKRPPRDGPRHRDQRRRRHRRGDHPAGPARPPSARC